MEEVQIPVEEPKDDQNHVDDMVMKADNLEKPQEDGQQKEEKLLAGKYKNVEELEKGYKELEKRLGQKAEAPKDGKIPEKKAEEPPKTDDKQAADFSAFTKEYTEKGELSPESYRKLQEMGMPKEMVDGYIEGQKTIADRRKSSIYGSVGGEENYMAMIEWAKENLSESEKSFFNTAIVGEEARATLAVQGLWAKYAKENNQPNLIMGDGNGSTNTGDVYQSKAQMTADMKDARYRSDPAFRQKVMDKIARSSII